MLSIWFHLYIPLAIQSLQRALCSATRRFRKLTRYFYGYMQSSPGHSLLTSSPIDDMNSLLNLKNKAKMRLYASAKEATTYPRFWVSLWHKGLRKQMDSVDAVLTAMLNRFY